MGLTPEQKARVEANRLAAMAKRAAAAQTPQGAGGNGGNGGSGGKPRTESSAAHALEGGFAPSGSSAPSTAGSKRPAAAETKEQRNIRARLHSRLSDNPFSSGGFELDGDDVVQAHRSEGVVPMPAGSAAAGPVAGAAAGASLAPSSTSPVLSSSASSASKHSSSTRSGGSGASRSRFSSANSKARARDDAAEGQFRRVSGGTTTRGVCEGCGCDESQVPLVGKLQAGFGITVCIECRAKVSSDVRWVSRMLPRNPTWRSAYRVLSKASPAEASFPTYARTSGFSLSVTLAGQRLRPD